MTNTFKDLTISSKVTAKDEAGYEITYSWKYKNKPVSMTVGVNKSAVSQFLIPNRYYYTPHLTIIHDLTNASDAQGHMDEIISLRKKHQTDITTPAWVLMEIPLEKQDAVPLTAKLSRSKTIPVPALKGLEKYFSSQLSSGLTQSSRFRLQDLSLLKGYYLPGLYGCESDGKVVANDDHHFSKIWRVKDGILINTVIEDGDPYKEGTATIPVRTAQGVMTGQLNVTTHLQQSRTGALFIQLPRSISYEDSQNVPGSHQKRIYQY